MEVGVTDQPTAESIARAKADQQRERQRIEQLTGLVILDDGRVIVPAEKRGTDGNHRNSEYQY